MDNIGKKPYDEMADTIPIRITSDPKNATILQALKDDDLGLNTMWLCDEPGESWFDYHLKSTGDERWGDDESEWLGCLIGKNTQLGKICFFRNRHHQDENNEDNLYNRALVPFWRGFTRNTSLKSISFFGLDLSDGGNESLFHKLDDLFVHNHNLEVFEVEDCILGVDGCRALSKALHGYQNKILTHVQLVRCAIDDESLAGIISSLGTYPLLQKLELKENDIGRNSCMALATLLQGFTVLHTLDLQHSNINDEGAALLADGLAGNCTLKTMTLSYNTAITVTGWAAFSRRLCDSTSVNNTYLSNHTLQRLSYRSRSIIPRDIDWYLHMNSNSCKKSVAIDKILKHHVDFNMQPFLQWGFMLLPNVVQWFEGAAHLFRCNRDSPKRRKLSCIYQFIRGMPPLYIDSCLSTKTKHTRTIETLL